MNTRHQYVMHIELNTGRKRKRSNEFVLRKAMEMEREREKDE